MATKDKRDAGWSALVTHGLLGLGGVEQSICLNHPESTASESLDVLQDRYLASVGVRFRYRADIGKFSSDIGRISVNLISAFSFPISEVNIFDIGPISEVTFPIK